jgi:hypothetical protein
LDINSPTSLHIQVGKTWSLYQSPLETGYRHQTLNLSKCLPASALMFLGVSRETSSDLMR